MDDGVFVRRAEGVAGLYATRAWKAGETICALDGIAQAYPTHYSIQVAPTEHLVPPLRAVADGDIEDYYRWCFINHSCAPNVYIDTATRTVVALADLAPGDELRYDYETTEWNMVEPFACDCGALSCRHHVRGFKHLTDTQRRGLSGPVAPHLLLLLRDLQALGADGHGE